MSHKGILISRKDWLKMYSSFLPKDDFKRSMGLARNIASYFEYFAIDYPYTPANGNTTNVTSLYSWCERNCMSELEFTPLSKVLYDVFVIEAIQGSAIVIKMGDKQA